jgi:hypothetical protein
MTFDLEQHEVGEFTCTSWSLRPGFDPRRIAVRFDHLWRSRSRREELTGAPSSAEVETSFVGEAASRDA